MTRPVIKVLEPGDESALEAFLLPQVETSMFLIGNMRLAGLEDLGQPYQGTYAAAFEAGKMVGVVAHYWNGNLVLQAPAHLEALWRSAVNYSQRLIEGLLGPNDQVSAVRDALVIDDSSVQLDEVEKLYSLRLKDMVVPEGLRSGKLRGRRIGLHDLELVTHWRVAFSIEMLGEVDNPQLWESCRQGIQRSIQEGRTWVLEDQGQPVACSSFNAAIKEAVQVGGVWTPPELRKRGYGRSVVAASLLDARSEGVETAILFTGESNVPAQRAYAALGFRHIGQYRLLLLRLPQRAALG